MAREITAEEIERLLKMEDAGDKKGVSKYITDTFGILGGQEARKALSNARTAANPSTSASGLEAALGLGGVGLGAGIAASRLTELVKGTTITYEAILRREVIADRLRTALAGDFGVRESGEEIVVSRVDPMGVFCRILVSVTGDRTTVVTSGLKLVEKKREGLIDSLVGVGKDVLAGQGLGGVLDFITDTALAAAEAGSDLWVANQLASTIETYGAELERKANAARSAAQVKDKRIVEIERLLGSCGSCGQPLPESGVCEACGATTEVATLRAELARLKK